MQLTTATIHPIATVTADRLGPDWTIDPHTTDHPTIDLYHSDGRHIGIRPLHSGTVLQLWATGIHKPNQPTTAPNPLAYLDTWHTTLRIGVLDPDTDVTTALFDKLTADLIPAFDNKPQRVGHRPWDRTESPTADKDQARPETAAPSETAAPAAPSKAAAPAAPKPPRTRKAAAAKPAPTSASAKPKAAPRKKAVPAAS